jgi:hypothetical protein
VSNLILAYNNRADAPATLSGGSWLAALPLTNLQDRVFAHVARSSDDALASTKFDLDLIQAKNIRVVALANHNASTNGLWRVRASDDSGFAVLAYDSGWVDIWPTAYAVGVPEWEDSSFWDYKPTLEERTAFTPLALCVLPQRLAARYWRVEIDDTANPDGYIEVGRLFLADAWQPEVNATYGAQTGYVTDTLIESSFGGTDYFDPRPNRRVARFVLGAMNLDTGLTRAFDLTRAAGISGEVLFVFDPDDTVHGIWRSFIGRLIDLSPLEYPFPDLHSMAFEILETL